MEGRKLRTHVWLVLCFFGTIIAGLVTTVLHMQKTLQDELLVTLHHAVTSIDTTLYHGEQAAIRGLEWQGKLCDESTLTGIRTLVATIPDVRTVNLVHGNEIYCTSVFGGVTSRIDPHDYTNGKLQLLGGNQMTPSRSLIVYRSDEHLDNSVLVGIDGYYLYNVINVLSGDTRLLIKVGNKVMTSDGRVTALPSKGDFQRLSSERFNYSVMADKSFIFSPVTFIKYEKGAVIVIVLLSSLITFLFSRYLMYINTLEFRLKKAIRQKQIHPWIQPIIDSASGGIIGGEVLLRWNHPVYGFIPPDVFISVAEQNGMIGDITKNCFYDVIELLEEYGGNLPETLVICFNVCARNFENDEIVELCRAFRNRVPSQSFSVVLEITERQNIGNSQQSLSIIHQLKTQGVKISLDDFGTGNANYSYISLFSPDYIKIDKAFTTNIKDNKLSKLVVESIITLANQLGCVVIAEGVENDEQHKILHYMGIMILQGYLFSRPVPIMDFLSIIRERRG